MVVNWPKLLIADIARRRSVIVLGAGISRQCVNASGARPKLWGEFLETANAKIPGPKTLHKVVKGLVRSGDLLTACEVVKKELGKSAFIDLMRAEFQTPQFQPAPIHDSIIKLDSRIVASPNFDKIFESRINALQNGSVVVKEPQDKDVADAVRGTQRVLLKIHGSIDRPDDVIFTRTDYAEARSKHHNFYDVLRALAITHTFIFLGCGLNDPDINLLLEDHAFKHNFGRPHYFVIPKDQVNRRWVQPVYKSSMNIEILEFDKAGGYVLLKTAIDELVTDVELARIDIQKFGEW